MNMLFLIYPVVLTILIFFGASFTGLVKPHKCPDPYAAHDDFFVQSKMIRAGACLFIILHHLVQKISIYGNIDKGPINVFNDVGYLLTAVYFFYSGYGLLTSFYSKEGYLDTFLIKRLPTILLPFWLINIINILINRFVYGQKEGIIEILKDVFGLQLVNGNGWFIIEIAVIYLMFYVIFRLVKNSDAAIILLGIAVLAIIPYAYSLGHDSEGVKSTWFHGEWWFISTTVFVLGIVYARFKKNFDGFIKKYYYPVLITSFVISLITHFTAVMCLRFLGYYHTGMPSATRDGVITLIAQNIDSCVFAFLILVLSMRISLGNRFLRFLSGVSLELFLIHGTLLELVFDKSASPDGVRFLIVYIVSIAATAVIAPVIDFVVKRAITFLKFVTADERNKKKVALGALSVLLVALAVVGGLLYGERFFFAKETYTEEMKVIKKAAVGEEVLFGRFDTNPLIPGAERMTWIVVSKKSGVATLLAKKGIDGYYYNQKHEAVSWKDSDLRAYINSDRYMKIFNSYEKKSTEPDPDGDYFSLLTADEAAAFFGSDKDRELVISDVAKNRGTNMNTMSKIHSWDMKKYHTSWWWLRGDDGVSDFTAPIVTEDGTIELGEKYVNKPAGAIRPVIWVKYGI
ncbi:MAG: acyltransferase [Butyrivibrio sp.]|nr:acyltransferase [Butyrivibrio sp.]